jgi:hypothetical protein
MKLDRVTITGADESVDPAELATISKKFPFVEWGILFSGSRRGVPRYPGLDWLERLDNCLRVGLTMNLSAHLCGRWVRDLVLYADFSWKAAYREFYGIFQRIQLNFHGEYHRRVTGFDTVLLDESPMRAMHGMPERPGKQFILQCDGVNDAAAEELVPWVNAVPLFDTSGGAGQLPEEWPDAWPGVYCGYAGGLGPDNLQEELRRIERAAGKERIWIDMERRVRSDDDRQFDLDKVRRVLYVASGRVES